MGIKLKLTGLRRFVRTEAEIADYTAQVAAAQDTLVNGTGAGNDFLGWLNLPVDYDRDEFARIKQAAKKIQQTCDVLIVIGIGGSYLGARAAIEFVNGQFYNQVRPEGIPEVYFAGNNISSSYLNDIIKMIGDRDFCINIISKSGTTTEPAIAFRELKKLCESKYGKEGARERIFATTDKERGALKKLADDEGYETFIVPDNIGGRFSVLTPVGLLPMAAAGLDIDAVMAGAAASRENYSQGSLHDCARYAALRNLLLFKGKSMEIMVNYEPSLVMLGEWLKQLFDESEGKDHRSVHSGRLAHHVRDRAVGQGTALRDYHRAYRRGYRRPELSGRSDRAARQPEGVRGHADRPHGRRHAEYHPRDRPHGRLAFRLSGLLFREGLRHFGLPARRKSV